LSVGSWTPNNGVEMTKSGNTFVAENVQFVAASGESLCFFNLTDALGADWDELNMTANRYGSATEGVELYNNSASDMVAYLNNVDAMGCLSWAVAPGTYKVVADFENMTITVISGQTGIDAILGEINDEAPVYYNLQGVRVAEPTSGLYIVRRGNKVSKEIIR
ncbi:MAG: hypothetical protein K2G64_07050, partial [Muribaculaceae bacterium]|nr:hypothetical protein [Muribaculaceae bacterium]